MTFVTQAQYRSDRRFATANKLMFGAFAAFAGYMFAKHVKQTRGNIETMTMAYNRHTHSSNNRTPVPQMKFL